MTRVTKGHLLLDVEELLDETNGVRDAMNYAEDFGEYPLDEDDILEIIQYVDSHNELPPDE
jgi:hypothetical protein